jgi:choline dehydrogenase-like flavoprotein
MAPYLRKFQTFTVASPETAAFLSLDRYMKPKDQGANGPIPTTLPDVYGPLNRAWDETFRRLGWRTDADPIAGRKVGTFTAPLSVDVKTGQRGYAANYYTPEVAQRPNLDLLPETLVERILLHTEADGQVVATGVLARNSDDSQQEIPATREVIVSGGTFNSPQLLELCGFGSAALLQEHHIPLVLDRPGVGENLQDHCLTAVSFEVADGQVSGDVMRDPTVVQQLMQLYEQTRGGPLSGMPISVAYLPLVGHEGRLSKDQIQDLLSQHLSQATQHTSSLSPAQETQHAPLRQMLLDDENPSTEYLFLPIQTHMHPGVTTMGDVLAKSLPGNYISIIVLHNHQFPRGTVHIQSPLATDKPVIDPNYLSHPLDIEILGRHVQFLDSIASTEPFAGLLKPGSRHPAEAADLSNLEKTKEIVKDRLFTCFHPVGTCAMMPADLGGVVDATLKVHGTRNLRVVDASIFPLEPSGNIQAAVYAVAERAADIIRADTSVTRLADVDYSIPSHL